MRIGDIVQHKNTTFGVFIASDPTPQVDVYTMGQSTRHH